MYVNSDPENSWMDDHSYRNLMLACLVIVLLFMIGMVRLWPASEYTPPPRVAIAEQELIFLDEIIITRQQSAPASPPRPVLPVPVPVDDINLPDIEFDFEWDVTDLLPLEPGTGTGQSGESARIVGNPERAPSVVRIVEASARQFVPEEYRGNFEIIVNFLVDENGDVEEAQIMEFRLYREDGGYESLSAVPDELMEAVVNAAMQWRFRPARDEGEAVKAFVRQRFNY